MKHSLFKRKTLIIVAVVWGFVLAVSGVINGNQAFTAPDMKELQRVVQKEKISGHALNCWIINQRSDFMILEFAKSNQCSNLFGQFPGYSCVNEKALNNPKWMRNALNKIKKQLIIFGATPEQSLDAASKLKKHGYAVRMLDRSDTTTLIQPASLTRQSIVNPVQQSQVSPLATPSVLSNQNSSDETEEEEGC